MVMCTYMYMYVYICICIHVYFPVSARFIILILEAHTFAVQSWSYRRLQGKPQSVIDMLEYVN